ncbi:MULTISPECIES: PTS mannitol transporter subunit IICBA [unclassified Gilliamella]|uniref:PTS mannitol transporter subunit IICBA n=1 Tax=unclassified Gilliamella TaxID=2685620 RepID=UPI002269A94C|nr:MULTISPECIES: PTS mannitol transporter subunit IICBA [unclassified Gilliamella]MCX8601130.1 PTS mannitol transporter subunit IICBA [Gilliamella sp. B3722]MCX8607284.1 PTS mannitol transporter subunit IICBA [Gilliamella sp. B3771]MCX8610527.1 PTS mannitol transporter subunit IICBA [Gilliamella sp. B3891]MCX8612804.1 PTS mannitol transporter subunit IICBA [Gilliamella sp. B3773]MCX8614713.1 PTS mannitol transporter subunit IICBA [Gilliamella sp. B3770]
MSTSNIKLKVQNFGRFLSNMVMPNIGAFIAWGFITAIFLFNAKDPSAGGWLPNEAISTSFIGPMITYLLPLLIGYTGGKLVYGERGGVVGAITTFGVIVGASIPMFLGAMISGPLGGWTIKIFDKAVEGKVKSGFEMLVNNFSAGILGMILALIAFFAIGPSVTWLTGILIVAVQFMVDHGLLPLTSILVEPAKVLFLNNAINHGVFTSLGVTQVAETGKSIFFLIEANPGPGLGLLLAYMFFGKGAAKGSASGAAIIHFFGGIHEIYFPYVLMNPRLIIAVILGGMTGIFTLTVFDAGLTAPASPGSIFAVMSMAKGSYLGVTLSVIAATAVSFVVSAILLKTTKNNDKSFEDAKSDVSMMKNEAKGSENKTFTLTEVKKIIVACDAGMGSSAMGAGVLRKKVQDANLDINVINLAINNLPNDADIVITHKDLTERAKQYAPDAHHISLTNFLDSDLYSRLVVELTDAQTNHLSDAQQNRQSAVENTPLFKLTEKNIFLDLTANSKEEAIRYAGQKLVDNGYVKPAYIEAMLERERLTSTFLGESIAVPHGTIEAKDDVITTGIVFCQYPAGVQFGEEEQDQARIVIGIAARNNEHLDVIAKLTNALDDPKIIAQLATTCNIEEVLTILS